MGIATQSTLGRRQARSLSKVNVRPEAHSVAMTLVKRGNLWHEATPTKCPEGHVLGSGRVLIGWNGSKRTYWCLTCSPVN